MMLFLGTVYAWSVFKIPLMQQHGWSDFEVGFTFTLVIAFIGLSAAFGGRFVDRAGVTRAATLAAILFGGGTLLAGLAAQIGNLWLLWLGYGVIAGIGNGLGYITPVAVLVRWFPDKRGVITGVAVMGFGFGAAIMGQIAPLIIPAWGVAGTFYFFGIVFLVGLYIAARKLVNPPEGYKPPVPAGAAGKQPASAALVSVDFQTAKGMFQFYILWGVLFLNITAGITILSNLSPLAQSQVGLTAYAAGTLIFVGSLFNGLGRIFWASVSDKLGCKNTFLLIVGTQIPLFFLLPQIQNSVLFGVLVCYILACYGGGFATMPAFAADTFGPRNIGSIYGPILLAWGAAGVLGPTLMEFFKESTGSFDAAIYAGGVLLIVGFLLVAVYRKPDFRSK